MYKLFALLLIVPFITPVFGQSKKEKEIELIKAARKESNEAIQRHDLEGIGKPMIEDMVSTFGNGHTSVGKESTISIFKNRFSTMPDLVFVRTPFVIRISNNDTLAWKKERGRASEQTENQLIALGEIMRQCGVKEMGSGKRGRSYLYR